MANINFAKNLKRQRELKGMTKTELAKRIGVSDVTLGHWEIGKISPRMGKVEMIAGILGITTDDLLFENTSNNFATKKTISSQIPLYGSIAAGTPLEMVAVEDLIEIPQYIAERYPSSFLLKVNGDSMNKIVPNGAYALIEPCEEVINGEIAAVVVDGFDATLKRFHRLQNTIVLEPDSYNADHISKMFNCNKDECESIKIIGKMVWFMSPFNIKF